MLSYESKDFPHTEKICDGELSTYVHLNNAHVRESVMYGNAKFTPVFYGREGMRLLHRSRPTAIVHVIIVSRACAKVVKQSFCMSVGTKFASLRNFRI